MPVRGAKTTIPGLFVHFFGKSVINQSYFSSVSLLDSTDTSFELDTIFVSRILPDKLGRGVLLAVTSPDCPIPRLEEIALHDKNGTHRKDRP